VGQLANTATILQTTDARERRQLLRALLPEAPAPAQLRKVIR